MSDFMVDTDGVLTEIFPSNDKYYERAELQSLLMGSVRLCPYGDEYVIINPAAEQLGYDFNGLGFNWLDEFGYSKETARGTVLRVSRDHINPSVLFDVVDIANKSKK